jgi:DNA repair protein RadD
MNDLPSLFPHQEDLRDRTRAALAKHRRVILCGNPGLGKTRIAKWILGATGNREPAANQSGHSLFCVHRRPLVDNASDSFSEEPKLRHGVIMSNRKAAYGARVQVASIDTLLSWFIQKGQYDTSITFDLCIWDEAHSHHDKFAKFLEHHDAFRKTLGLHPAFVIGLTATPEAKGIADVYREIVLGPPTQWLIDNGFLAPFRYFRATQGRMGLLVRRGGEFTPDSVDKAMQGLSGALVRDWERFAKGRPTVGFFPRRQHAQEARLALEEAGLRVAYVDGDTDDAARKRMFWELNNERLDYLCNVQVLERGTDIPRIQCVQLCVAIGSLPRFRQVIGRGSRVHPEKQDCLILDHGGNVVRHGFFEDDPLWSLDRSSSGAGEVQVRPTIECPKCQAIYRGGKCRQCGYEPTKQERKGQGLEFDGTELREVTRKDKAPVRVKSAEELMLMSLYAAGRSGRTWKQAVGMFLGMAKKQGTKYRVPKRVTVGGNAYWMLPFGHPESGRRVGELFPWTVGRGNHGGKFLEMSSAEAE